MELWSAFRQQSSCTSSVVASTFAWHSCFCGCLSSSLSAATDVAATAIRIRDGPRSTFAGKNQLLAESIYQSVPAQTFSKLFGQVPVSIGMITLRSTPLANLF